MSSADMAVLIDMGFSKSNVERALNVTGHKGVEPAMEWLLAHADSAELSSGSSNNMAPVEQPPVNAATANDTEASAPTAAANENSASAAAEQDGNDGGASAEAELAKSIKCDVCGKLFKTNLEVEFHATKSGHDQFSESTEEKKPLTEEEKRHQLQLLEEKLKQKRKEREEKEKNEALEREKMRIRTGKEMTQARQKFEELEMKKMLEQRRREKEEDRLARQKIREQIEADKAARRNRSVTGDPLTTPKTETKSPPSTNQQPSATTLRKDYTETRLQIRLTNGQVLTQNFGCKEQLSAVRLYIEMNRTDDNGPFILMTNFPRKVFTDVDYDAPLDALGLVPSAVIIVQKKST